mmetsp:Transcript_28910/g.92330  ORF Transcript_28910/g.92330 Transcript_28910/m.92330 type:complete len:125 (-) Transcript_28910:144-518(-)
MESMGGGGAGEGGGVAKASTMHHAAAGFFRGLAHAEERRASEDGAGGARPASPGSARSVPESPGMQSVQSDASASREEELVRELEGVEADLAAARGAGDSFQEEILSVSLQEMQQELRALRGQL